MADPKGVGTFGADGSKGAEAPGELQKPPLGALPKWLWRELRVINLSGAVRRRIAANLTKGEHALKMQEWLGELMDLVVGDAHLFGVMLRELGREDDQGEASNG